MTKPKKSKKIFLVHRQPRDCPRAQYAFELTKREAEMYRRDPFCMACGHDALKVIG